MDVLRAVAVLCVVADHFAWPFTNGALWAWGAFGVFLFFVHTSLVLMASLERMARAADSNPSLVWAFYVRRAFRIYPLAWASVALVLLAHMPTTVEVLPPHPALAFIPPTWAEITTNLTLTQNIGPQHRSLLGVLWTLPIEVQMYVLLPALWWVARRPDGGRWLWAMIVFAVPLGLVSHFIFPNWPLVWRTPTVLYYAPCFLGGIVAYRLLRDRQRRAVAAPWPAPAWFAVMLAAALLFWAGHATSLHTLWRGWFACLVLGAMLPFVRELSDSWLTRAAKQVATYSYGVYLLHVPAQWVGMVGLARFPWAVRWGVSAILVVTLPVLAYHLIERPGIELGQEFVHRLMHRQPMTGAATDAA